MLCPPSDTRKMPLKPLLGKKTCHEPKFSGESDAGMGTSTGLGLCGAVAGILRLTSIGLLQCSDWSI
jgi:hypothetical protein